MPPACPYCNTDIGRLVRSTISQSFWTDAAWTLIPFVILAAIVWAEAVWPADNNQQDVAPEKHHG